LQAEPGSAFHAPKDAAAFLSDLPVLRLPAAWETKTRLVGFGLETIGSVAQLSFDAMQGEFGKEGARLWHLARGEDDERLVPRSHEERLSVETTFATPSVSLPVILVALEGLSIKAFKGLRGRFARVATLEGRLVQRPPWSKRIAFKEPVGDATKAFHLLRDRLSQLVLPSPLETLSLTLTGLTGESGRQESLFRDVQRHANLDNAIRQLRSRMWGQPQIYQVRELQQWSRIPERRRALVPYEP
jgi:DNA polymerase-4/protein ImuB